MQKLNIVSVTMTPQPVGTGEKFLISVDIKPATHGFLGRFTHAALKRFTHNQVANHAIDK